MAAKQPSSAQILRGQIEKAKRQNPAYSLRALARSLKISPSYLSDLVKGKRPFPRKRLADFVRALKIDGLTAAALSRAVNRELLERSGLRSDEPHSPEKAVTSYKEQPTRTFTILRKWYFVAILDLAACKGSSMEAADVARRLDIREAEAQSALEELKKEGWLKLRGGKWEKADARMRFPTASSHDLIRDFHRQMIMLAAKELGRSDEHAFQNRMITGLTFSANPNHLEKAKVRLQEALFEVAEMLTEGECTEVFQLGAQLFPLSRSLSE